MSIEDLKKKIEAKTNYNPAAKIVAYQEQNFTDEQIALFLDGISDNFFVNEAGTNNPTNNQANYEFAFTAQITNLKDKQYQNLSYNELRYAVNILDESSDDFKEVVKNLTNDSLGPALEEFSFEQFDADVSLKINELISILKEINSSLKVISIVAIKESGISKDTLNAIEKNKPAYVKVWELLK